MSTTETKTSKKPSKKQQKPSKKQQKPSKKQQKPSKKRSQKKQSKKPPQYSLITNDNNEIHLYLIAHGDGYRIQNTLNNNLNDESISANFSKINEEKEKQEEQEENEYPIIYNNTKPLYVWTSTLEKDKKVMLFYHLNVDISSKKLVLRPKKDATSYSVDELQENIKVCTPIELINNRQKFNKDDVIFNQVSSMQMEDYKGYDNTNVDDNFGFFIIVKNKENEIEIKKLNIKYLELFFENMQTKKLKKHRPRLMEIVNKINEKIIKEEKITFKNYIDNKNNKNYKESVIIGNNKNLVLNTLMCSPNSESDLREDLIKEKNEETGEKTFTRAIEEKKCLKILLITVLRFIIYYEAKNKFMESYKVYKKCKNYNDFIKNFGAFEGYKYNFMDGEEIGDLINYTKIFMANYETFLSWENKNNNYFSNQMEEFKKVLCDIKKVDYENNNTNETKTTNEQTKIREYINTINLDWIYEYYIFQVTHTETDHVTNNTIVKKFITITQNLKGGIMPTLLEEENRLGIKSLIHDKFQEAKIGGKKRKKHKKHRKKTKKKSKRKRRKKTKKKSKRKRRKKTKRKSRKKKN